MLVHLKPEKFEKADLFLRLGPSTVHTNLSRKRSSNRQNLKISAFRFSVDERHFENGDFRKRGRVDNRVINPKPPKGGALEVFNRR